VNFAVHYHRNFRYLDEVDEIIFKYKGTESLVEDLPNMILDDQCAIVSLEEIEDIEEIVEYLSLFKQVHPNFKVQIFYDQRDWLPVFKDLDIDYMYLNYANKIDDIYILMADEVSDIYIAEGLCFNLKELQPIRDKGIKIRTFPDVAQYHPNYKGPDIFKFFIRPEDLDIYEKYIDVLEFFRIDNSLSALYTIYNRRQWLGNLNTLIMDIPSLEITNTAIPPIFGETRVNCGHKCMIGDCHLCERFQIIAPKIDENNMGFVHKAVNKIPERKKQILLKDIEEVKNEHRSYEEPMLRTQE